MLLPGRERRQWWQETASARWSEVYCCCDAATGEEEWWWEWREWMKRVREKAVLLLLRHCRGAGQEGEGTRCEAKDQRQQQKTMVVNPS